MSFASLRPGVYSSYTVSARYATPRSRQGAGLVCKGNPALVGSVFHIGSEEQAKGLLGEESPLALACTQILLESGVSRVVVSLVDDDYARGAALLETVEDIGIIVCDGTSEEISKILLDSVEKSSGSHRDRMLFLGEKQVDKAVLLALARNHPRCVVTCGDGIYGDMGSHPLYVTAALAGYILRENRANCNLNGAELTPLLGMTTVYGETEIQNALRQGVTPVEVVGGVVECVRGVTTKTSENGVADFTLRSINTLLIIDDVLRTIRSALRAKLKGANQMATSLGSVASQVTVELAEKKEQGLLAEYLAPRVYSDTADPSVCVVELAFHVAHVISQIHIKAHVRL